MKKILIIITIVAVSLVVCFYSADQLTAYARSVIFKSGVVLKNNVSIRSGSIDQRNGSASTGDYPKSSGGVDDYNAGGATPTDSFSENFTQCTSANNYCSTNDATACSGDVCYQDNRTNLVWSDWTGGTQTWFVANSCQYPNGLGDGTCDTHGEAACKCVKQTSGNETGCEDLGDGNWRLPHQKELMQVYINGSWKNLSNPGDYFWSATTQSYATHNAWYAALDHGYTRYSNKTTAGSYYARCVRR